MRIDLDSAAVPVREERLGSVTGYYGDFNDLVKQSRCGSLKNRERCFTQSSSCMSGCAIGQLSVIRDIAIIYHAPAGCCAGASASNIIGQQLAARIDVSYNSVLVGSDLDENDTIFGALNQVRALVHRVNDNYKPKAIFVASSCVSGVIGEDVDGLVEELKNELDVPITAIHCEGFKSRIWASGFDVSDHAVLQGIVKPPREKRPVINYKNFFESERQQITELFARLGVTPQFLYSNSSVEELEHLSESLATVCNCGSLGTYLGNGLEELYGVPYLRVINPCGMQGFETWMREIGRIAGKPDEAERILAEERAKYLPKIEKLHEEIKALQLTAVIGMGPGFSYEVARVLQELDIEVVWILNWHYDYQHDNGEIAPAVEYLSAHPAHNFGLSVADQQNFELLNILNTYKPDLYFSRHPGSTVWGIKQGVSAIYVGDEYMIFGYKGLLSFAQTLLDTVRNRSFEKNLAARVKLPYTEWWYNQENQRMLAK
jgi:nitrogenase molybdenum-iron protein alpha chain